MTVEMDNAAFMTEDGAYRPNELIRVLKKTADQVDRIEESDLNEGPYGYGTYVRDVNGNTIGSWDISTKASDPEGPFQTEADALADAQADSQLSGRQ
jgi:hypothetical protein